MTSQETSTPLQRVHRNLSKAEIDALREKLAQPKEDGEPAWMKYFGSMKGHSEELRRIDAAIEEEFERIDPEMWK